MKAPKTKGNNRPWLLAETTLKMYRRAPLTVAVLPVGSTEPHNLHLPCGSDFLEAAAIAAKSCEIAWKKGARAVALPAVPFGTNSNFTGFPGFINLNPTTHLEILRDIVQSLEQYKVRKLVIINGHGGNDFEPLLRQLYAQTKVFISAVNWWQISPEFMEKLFKKTGQHADEMETSIMLHLYPHLVNLKEADTGRTRMPRLRAMREGWVIYTRPWQKLTINSGYGNPRLASAEKGRGLFEFITNKIAAYLMELALARLTPGFPYTK